MRSNHQIAAACPIDADTYVLEVGCGAGAMASYLAQAYGCRVMGVDLRESVQDRVEFRVANTLRLPFADGQFDVALCESVATFILRMVSRTLALYVRSAAFRRYMKGRGRLPRDFKYWGYALFVGRK